MDKLDISDELKPYYERACEDFKKLYNADEKNRGYVDGVDMYLLLRRMYGSMFQDDVPGKKMIDFWISIISQCRTDYVSKLLVIYVHYMWKIPPIKTNYDIGLLSVVLRDQYICGLNAFLELEDKYIAGGCLAILKNYACYYTYPIFNTDFLHTIKTQEQQIFEYTYIGMFKNRIKEDCEREEEEEKLAKEQEEKKTKGKKTKGKTAKGKTTKGKKPKGKSKEDKIEEEQVSKATLSDNEDVYNLSSEEEIELNDDTTDDENVVKASKTKEKNAKAKKPRARKKKAEQDTDTIDVKPKTKKSRGRKKKVEQENPNEEEIIEVKKSVRKTRGRKKNAEQDTITEVKSKKRGRTQKVAK